MKRIISLFIALLLTVSCLCAAAADGVSFATDYFTLTLPDGWLIEMDDLETAEDIQELGFFGEDRDIGIIAGAYLVYYDELSDFALWSADEDEIEAYAEGILEEFEGEDAEWIDTIMAGSIPIILIRSVDEEGEYLYADTITNGYSIQFEVYVTDMEGEKTYPFTDKQLEDFKDILASFVPVA